MSDRWRRVRIAASLEDCSGSPYGDDESVSRSADAIVVDGMVVGASFGGDAYEREDLELYGDPRKFASGSPEPRAGAYDPYKIDRPQKPVDRDNRITAATLQRENRIASSGHGHGRGGERRQSKPSAAAISSTATAGTNAGEGVQMHLPRHLVYGLTIGEAEFYGPRRDEARAVLQQLAAQIWLERMPPEPQKTKQVGKPRPNFAVYGLSPAQVSLLTACRGAARARLVDYAHEQDHDRIIVRDASYRAA